MERKKSVVNKKATWMGDWRRRQMSLDPIDATLTFTTDKNEFRSITYLGKNIQVANNPADSTGRQLFLIEYGRKVVIEMGSVRAKMEWMKSLQRVIDAKVAQDCAGTFEDSEKQALVEFYEATGGTQWHIQDNWLTSKPIGEWYGIEVDAAGRVTEISLGMNNLKGTLPNSIGVLTKLTVFHLHWNELEGSLPDNIGRLSDLVTLSLDTNKFSGNLPQSFSALTQLRELNISQNQLEGGLQNLRELELLSDLVVDDCMLEDLQLPAEIAAFATDYYGAKRLAGSDAQVVLEYLDDRMARSGEGDV